MGFLWLYTKIWSLHCTVILRRRKIKLYKCTRSLNCEISLIMKVIIGHCQTCQSVMKQNVMSVRADKIKCRQ